MPDPHFTALDAQLADAHEEARRLALEVERLRGDLRTKLGECCPQWKAARVHHLDCPMMMRDAYQRALEASEARAAVLDERDKLRKALGAACDLIDEEVPSAGSPGDQARFAEWRRLAEGKS